MRLGCTRVTLVGVVVLMLVAAACGSRKSGPPPGAVEVGAGAGTTPAGGSPAATASPGGAQASSAARVGTLKAACGKGSPARGATDKGVSDTTITIGVVSDKSGVVAVPTAGIDGSVEAFVEFCNELGGINGRQLVLKHYDSKILNEGDAVKQACEDDVFALVGSGSVQDDQGAEAMVECKLVEVAAYTATYRKSLSPRVFQPVPNRATSYTVGPGKFMAKRFPTAVKKAGILWPNLPVARIQAARQQDAFEKVGFKFVYANPTDVLVANWGPVVASLKDKSIEWVTDVTTLSEVEHLLQSMGDAGLKPKVVDLGQQYYDESFPGKPGSEGAFVLTNTAPFEESSRNPALKLYLDRLKKASANTPPTTLGVQAFSAGLLFAQAASALGSNVTREGLISELRKVKRWDGGGLHMRANPGDGKNSDCFLYMQIKNGKFVRFWPKKPTDGTNGFDCAPGNSVELTKQYEQLPAAWSAAGG